MLISNLSVKNLSYQLLEKATEMAKLAHKKYIFIYMLTGGGF